MATGSIIKPQKIESITVTGKTDSNAYLETGLLSANNVFLGATNAILNGTRFKPIMVTPLFDGGTGGNAISLRIANYAGDITQFKNVNISVTVFYMKV